MEFRNAILTGPKLIEKLLLENKDKIEAAYLKCGDKESYKVTVGVKFTGDIDRVKIEADIAFVESKIQASASLVISDQTPLPFENED